MAKALQAVLMRIEALKINERALVLGAGLLLIYAVAQMLVLGPVAKERRQLVAQYTNAERRITEKDAEIVGLKAAAKKDPNVALQGQLRALEQKIAAAEQAVTERAGALLPPEEMPQVLETVLKRIAGAQFHRLVSLGAEPLFAETKSSKQQGAASGFRHGFKIEFQGSYLEALAYLQALEALPWRFFWESVQIDVQKHPQANVKVVLYTLSLDRRWLGV